MTETDMQTEEAVNSPTEKRVECCPFCGGTATHRFLRAPDRFHGRIEAYDLVRCSGCSGVWLTDPPAPHDMSYHYDDDYHQTIAIGGEQAAASRWQRQRDLILGFRQSGSILDIGCSSGGFLGTLKGKAWKLYGIEMEASTAAKARANSGAEVFVGDAVDAPFPANGFDAITCFDVLEHVYEPRQVLMKVLEWLKPGGIFYVVVPNIDSWESRFFGSYWYGLELPRHLSHFSPSSLRHLTGSLGFEETNLITRTSYIERSMGYVCSRVVGSVGVSLDPPSKPRRRGIPWRAARKAIRMSLIAAFAKSASLAGSGASIEAVFTKKS